MHLVAHQNSPSKKNQTKSFVRYVGAGYAGIHICGSSEVFECPSEKKPPDHRRIVYPVYLQVYVLPLIGGYESKEKTIAQKRAHRQSYKKRTQSLLHLHRKKSNKELCKVYGCWLMSELAAGYVGIHIYVSSEVFECPSEKRPPDHRRIVYPVYFQVYVLPLIGGYESTEKTIVQKMQPLRSPHSDSYSYEMSWLVVASNSMLHPQVWPQSESLRYTTPPILSG